MFSGLCISTNKMLNVECCKSMYQSSQKIYTGLRPVVCKLLTHTTYIEVQVDTSIVRPVDCHFHKQYHYNSTTVKQCVQFCICSYSNNISKNSTPTIYKYLYTV